MIKKFIYPLVAIILLSSCASKFSMQKRKYNKGFYFASSKGNKSKSNEATQLAVKPSSLKSKPVVNLPLESRAAEPEIAYTPTHENTSLKVNTTITTKLSHTSQNALVASAINKPVVTNHSYKKLSDNQVNLIKSSKKSGGANIIVLVILSLFPILCLIAVYLHDGKSITLNFWIDLLLHLTFIGMIIFALLVVLDVVNLA